MLLSSCTKCFLSVQPNFVNQKYEIEDSITNSANEKHYLMRYHPKYHYELNNIKDFWCIPKK